MTPHGVYVNNLNGLIKRWVLKMEFYMAILNQKGEYGWCEGSHTKVLEFGNRKITIVNSILKDCRPVEMGQEFFQRFVLIQDLFYCLIVHDCKQVGFQRLKRIVSTIKEFMICWFEMDRPLENKRAARSSRD